MPWREGRLSSRERKTFSLGRLQRASLRSHFVAWSLYAKVVYAGSFGDRVRLHLVAVQHPSRMRILIVEDEEKMAKALRRGLEADQFSVSVARTGEEGFFLASTEPFDLIILDLMLPERDGMEVLAALRQKQLPVPVLILTSKDTVRDRVRGLDAGADDYLVKPFAFSELLARIRALLRRSKTPADDTLRLADLEMDTVGRVVLRGGKQLTLTAREFDLLEYLLRQQGRVVSREMLARDVWQETARYTPLDNVIDVHIAHLRRKLDEPFGKKLLHTVRGVGFVLREETP